VTGNGQASQLRKGDAPLDWSARRLPETPFCLVDLFVLSFAAPLDGGAVSIWREMAAGPHDEDDMHKRQFHFSTRDLLLMAALAALGGVAGTYINAVGDIFQSFLGFAGTTQWAAGLHVLWLVLSVGLTRKVGAGTVTGLLKGGVELLSGNTHGLMVLLIDLVAGLLVDLGFLADRRKNSWFAYCLAAVLASASNVFVFQLFAALPTDTLAYWAMLLVGLVAALSGLLFAGVLGRVLVNTLRKAGVVRDAAPAPTSRRVLAIFLVVAALLSVSLFFYLRVTLKGPNTVHIGGAVEAPYDYPVEFGDARQITTETTMSDKTSSYTGVAVRELLAHASAAQEAGLLLIHAADGYSYFLSMKEVEQNASLLLSPRGEGDDRQYDIVGAVSPKAWVRGVTELLVVSSSSLDIGGKVAESTSFRPQDWQETMDSTSLDLGNGKVKVQGAPLSKVLRAAQPNEDAETVVSFSDDVSVSLELPEVLASDDLRLFSVIGEESVSYALAYMDGRVLLTTLTRIELQ